MLEGLRVRIARARVKKRKGPGDSEKSFLRRTLRDATRQSLTGVHFKLQYYWAFFRLMRPWEQTLFPVERLLKEQKVGCPWELCEDFGEGAGCGTGVTGNMLVAATLTACPVPETKRLPRRLAAGGTRRT